jgi:TonB family protein
VRGGADLDGPAVALRAAGIVSSHARAATTVALLLATAAGSSAAHAGGTPGTPGQATCEDSIGLGSTDTIAAAVVARLRAFDPEQGVPRILTDVALYEIAERFRAPTPLALPAYTPEGDTGKWNDAPGFGHLVVNAMYGLAVGRDGRLSRARTITSSLNPLLDQRVLEAIRAADSARMIPPGGEELKGALAELRLLLSTTTRTVRDTGVVLFRLRTPRVRFSQLVRPADNRGVRPRYPTQLRAARMEGRVLAQFVVNRDGGVEPGSINIVRAAHVQFVESVLEALPRFRFRPARIGTCAVATLAQMPFEFLIR